MRHLQIPLLLLLTLSALPLLQYYRGPTNPTTTGSVTPSHAPSTIILRATAWILSHKRWMARRCNAPQVLASQMQCSPGTCYCLRSIFIPRAVFRWQCPLTLQGPTQSKLPCPMTLLPSCDTGKKFQKITRPDIHSLQDRRCATSASGLTNLTKAGALEGSMTLGALCAYPTTHSCTLPKKSVKNTTGGTTWACTIRVSGVSHTTSKAPGPCFSIATAALRHCPPPRTNKQP